MLLIVDTASVFSSKFLMHDNVKVIPWTMLIHAFCKICEHEIVLQERKLKQKQFQGHNSYKTCE